MAAAHYIACTLATRHPALVGSDGHRFGAAHRLTPSHRRVLRFFELCPTHPSLPARPQRLLMAFASGATFRGPVPQYPGFVDQAARLWTLDPEDVPGALAQIEHLRSGWDLGPALAAVACPTLVLAGELDPLVAAVSTRELAAGIIGAS